MSTETKNKIGILSLLSQIFGENDYETDNVELPKDLKNELDSLKKLEENVEVSLTTDKKSSSNKSGISKKVNIAPKTEEAMRKIHKEVKKEIDREI